MNKKGRIILLIATVIILSACSKTPQEKANALIKEHMQKVLYHPDTYDSAETIIDSAFSPIDDPEIHQKLLDAYELGTQLYNLDRKIKSAKSRMLIWSDNYNEFSRNKYNTHKEEYESLLAQQEKLQEKLKKMKAENDLFGEKIKKEGKKFIGFKAKHTYRCQNNAGKTVFGNQYFLFDKKMTEILESFDIDGDEYNAIQLIFDELDEISEGSVEK